MKRAFEEADDGCGKCCRQEIEDGPGQAQFHRARHWREDAVFLGQADHLVHVLGAFFLDDVDDIVDGDNAFQAAAFVDDGQRQKLVFGDDARGVFLIHEDIGFDRIGDHHVAQFARRRRDHQIADRHHAHQLAVFVDDIEIEKALKFAALADFIDGALGGGVRWQRHEIGGHQAADGAVGVVDDFAHRGLALRVEQRHDSLAALVGEAVDEHDRVVRVGARDQPADFVIVDQGENVG